MTQGTSAFQDAWKAHVNGSDDLTTNERLRTCLDAASTLDEMIQVFNASLHDMSDGVRSPALKKMFTVVTNEAEARRVYDLASKRGAFGYLFKSREREARELLAKFTHTG